MQEKTLKRTQICIAILAGIVTFIVGAYNIKNIFFPKKEITPAVSPSPAAPNPIRSAVEEVGATWIRKWGTPKSSVNQE